MIMITELAVMALPTKRLTRLAPWLVASLVFSAWSCAHSESADETESPSSYETSEASTEDSTGTDGAAEPSDRGADSERYAQHPEVERLQTKTTRLDAKTEALELQSALQSYYLTNEPHQFPESLAALTEGERPLAGEELLTDPWGNRYIYRKEGDDGVEVFSAGPDGEPGTEDDVHPSDEE